MVEYVIVMVAQAAAPIRNASLLRVSNNSGGARYVITMPVIVHSNSSEECFNWLKAVRETMRSMSEKVSYRRKLSLRSVNPIHNRPPCCFRSRASEQSSMSAPRVASSPPARSRVSALTSMQPPAAPAVERRVSRIQAGG